MPTRIKNKSGDRLPASLDELVRIMPPMAIRDDAQHSNTIELVDRLMQIDKLSQGQSHYLETLLELVEAYETRHHPIDVSNVNGVQMLRHILGQSGMSGSDLARLLKMHPTMGSKILSGLRKLTWEHAKILLAQRFNVAPALFMD